MLMEQIASSDSALLAELHAVNANLVALTQAVAARSFWDGQLAASLVGVLAALGAVLFGHAVSWWLRRRRRIHRIIEHVVDQHEFWKPTDLVIRTRNQSFGGTRTDAVFGTTEKQPQKPLGERMVIELRRKTWYTRWPKCKLRRLLASYEETLRSFGDCNPRNQEQLRLHHPRAQAAYEAIAAYVYRKTGLDQWTRD